MIGRTKGDISKTLVLATLGKHNAIDLKFVSDAYKSPDDKQALNDVFVATETLLGEERLDQWIGVVEVDRLHPTPDVDLGALPEPSPIRELPRLVSELIAAVDEKLPEKPLHKYDEDNWGWTNWKHKPKKQSDYSDQFDLITASTMAPDVWDCAHSRANFDSRRFSRCGELFCYLKMDSSEDPDHPNVDNRSVLEDALTAALREKGVGCIRGGGMGLKYTYIELALVDVKTSATLIKKILRDRDIHRRSWLLFHDDRLATEWIGVWDDTPHPPLDEELH
ncbi:MAG: hypothetical protein ACKVJX_01885 [Verrucomicrobiia bacterium]